MFEQTHKRWLVRPLLPMGDGWDEGLRHCAFDMKRSRRGAGPLPRGEGDRWSLHLLIVFTITVLCILLSAGHVYAQDQTDDDILAALNDEDYFLRQAQTRRLLGDHSLTPEAIDRLYIASTTAEQRHRLLRVARHHMIRRMIDERFGERAGAGSMGLSHHVVNVTGPDGETQIPGVMVVMTLPGFPAYASLEPGDVIIEFDGESIPERISPSRFQQMIRQHQANDSIDLTILRRGKAERIKFVLCHGDALNQVYITGGLHLSDTYRRRWAAERLRMQALIGQREPE